MSTAAMGIDPGTERGDQSVVSILVPEGDELAKVDAERMRLALLAEVITAVVFMQGCAIRAAGLQRYAQEAIDAHERVELRTTRSISQTLALVAACTTAAASVVQAKADKRPPNDLAALRQRVLGKKRARWQ